MKKMALHSAKQARWALQTEQMDVATLLEIRPGYTTTPHIAANVFEKNICMRD